MRVSDPAGWTRIAELEAEVSAMSAARDQRDRFEAAVKLARIDRFHHDAEFHHRVWVVAQALVLPGEELSADDVERAIRVAVALDLP